MSTTKQPQTFEEWWRRWWPQGDDKISREYRHDYFVEKTMAEAGWDAAIASQQVEINRWQNEWQSAEERHRAQLAEAKAEMKRSVCEHEFGALGAISGDYCIHCGAKLSEQPAQIKMRYEAVVRAARELFIGYQTFTEPARLRRLRAALAALEEKK